MVRALFLILIHFLASSCSEYLLRIDINNNFHKASGIFGQKSFSEGTNIELGLYQPRAGQYIGNDGKQIVVEYAGKRVLIWNSPLRDKKQAPSLALGQPNNVSIGVRGTTAQSFGPSSACSDGTKFVVADYDANRVLIWNSFPTHNLQAADVVLGQPDFEQNTGNNGGRSASSLSRPYHVHCSENGKLFVSDYANNRVLFWNSIPSIMPAPPADGVLGQANFTVGTLNTGGRTAARMYSPMSVTSDSNMLFVVDRNNHRILGWNTSSPASFSAADFILGQDLPTSGTVNNGGLSEKSLNAPIYALIADSKFIVSDMTNNRTLIWDPIPTTDFAPATTVLGQDDFLSSTNHATQTLSHFTEPMGASWDGQYLFIVSNLNKITAYNGVPSMSGSPGDFIYGQHLDSDTLRSDGAEVKATTVKFPYGIYSTKKNSWIVDAGRRRILQWKHPHTPFNSLPDLVIGQNSFSESQSLMTQGGLSAPRGIVSDGTRLVVVDAHRILIWNTIPTSNGQNADLVLGQTDFLTNDVNHGGLSASSLYTATDVKLTADGKLIVVDYDNNRALIWNTFPISNNAPASVVLGQTNFTTNTANTGGLGPASLSRPWFAHIHGTKLFLSERNNNRISIWNTIPVSNNTPADLVIGQQDHLSSAINAGLGVGNSLGMSSPTGIAYNGKKLFIAEHGNGRIMIWNQLPSSNGVSADDIIGRSHWTQTGWDFDPSATQLVGAMGIILKGNDLWVSDYMSDRVLLFKNADPDSN